MDPLSPSSRSEEVERLLGELPASSEARSRLFVLLYDELRTIAAVHLRDERAGHTLAPTGLVHEAFIKLAGQGGARWKNEGHFLAIAATAIRRILVDHARSRNRLKRGGGDVRRVTLEYDAGPATVAQVDLEGLDEALDELARLDDRQAALVELKFFGGLSNEAVAQVLGVSVRTVEGEWAMAKAWLKRRLTLER